jgi:hypothetical protein
MSDHIKCFSFTNLKTINSPIFHECLSDGSVPVNWNKPFPQQLEEFKLTNWLVTGKTRVVS